MRLKEILGNFAAIFPSLSVSLSLPLFPSLSLPGCVSERAIPFDFACDFETSQCAALIYFDCIFHAHFDEAVDFAYL